MSEFIEGVVLNYSGLYTSGEKWDLVARDLTELAQALQVEAKCLQWLGSRTGPERLLSMIHQIHTQFAVSDSFLNKDGTVNEDWATTDDIPGAPRRIVLNYSTYAADSRPDRWDTLLHEFAHLTDPEGFIQNDGDNDLAQDHNQKLLHTNCLGAMLKAGPR